jgi:hypothetical protein
MLDRARKLLPNLEKLERLLGHKLGITAEVLEARVEEAIRKQVELHDLKEVLLKPADTDWNELVRRSVFRLIPFDPGEKEKGFRDAVLLETLTQLVAECFMN